MLHFTRDSLTFDITALGSKDNETFVLLHGFPADAESWAPTAEQLAKQGYKVLVPELRGYSPQARPKHRKDYSLSELVADVVALLDSSEVQAAHIVGHDWGGVVAWAFADKHPERTLSLTSISTPHPKALIQSILRSRQIFLSWYMVFFQFPLMPEWTIGGKRLKKSLIESGLSTDIASRYAARMSDHSRLQGAINWYRALPWTLREARKMRSIKARTLFICGQKDIFTSHQAAKATKKWVSGRYTFVDLSNGTHWIPEESPEWLADEIVRFIEKSPA